MAKLIDVEPDDHCSLPQTEMHIDGKFVAGWARIKLDDFTKGVVCNMIEQAVRHGEEKAKAEIRKVLGAR